MYKRSELAKLTQTIVAELSRRNISVAGIEFEGPEIAIYIWNPKALAEHPEVAKELAKKLKKRIVIRVHPSARKSEEETKEIIKKLIPPEAGADLNDIKFDRALGEVIIKAKKVGLAYGKGRSIYYKILSETGWRLNVVRYVEGVKNELKIIEGMLNYMVEKDNSRYRLEFLRKAGNRIHRGVIFENRYVRVIALGGFMEVGRSAILVETSESKVLLDIGVHPSATGYNMYPRLDVDELKLDELDAVVVTHAHLDHCGLVPYLFKYGYRGPVYMTKPTRDLMVLALRDFIDIVQRGGAVPPYSWSEVERMILHTITLDYGEVTDIAPDIKLTFYNAGHILGSAMAHLHIGEGLHNIVYTGDFKYARTMLLDKAHDEFPRVETLIMESTYGNRKQPSRREAIYNLIEYINRALHRGGKVLIPVLAIGRAQEILLVLVDMLKKNQIPKDTKIYIDGSIRSVTAVHLMYPELLSPSVRAAILKGENPFEHENVIKVEAKKGNGAPMSISEVRKAIVESDEKAVILAPAGMLTGGPSVEYLRLMASDPRNMLIFVSYQAPGTLGRRIRDGERRIVLPDEEGKPQLVEIKMEVREVDGFSGHSDRDQLLRFLENMRPKPKNIILNHGEAEAIMSLAREISRKPTRYNLPGDVKVYTPSILDSITVAGVT